MASPLFVAVHFVGETRNYSSWGNAISGPPLRTEGLGETERLESSPSGAGKRLSGNWDLGGFPWVFANWLLPFSLLKNRDFGDSGELRKATSFHHRKCFLGESLRKRLSDPQYRRSDPQSGMFIKE
ncbi:MAG: hypothetical protein NZ602_14105 [Thermoguttaceae bacterium]|nr:hypothetical protein [Thermoguttaceae bacterium]MDW8036962.1 hypothetical protein [Thermoguttaceae bacterium]